VIAPKHVIIEGTDGVGKTTYAKRLAERDGMEYRHADAPTHDSWQDEYLSPLIAARRPVVFDRWHVGEMVWPSLFGRPSLFTQQSWHVCNHALHLLGVKKIMLVIRDDAAIADTLSDRGETDEQIALSLSAQRDFITMVHTVRHIPVEIVHSDTLQEV
jgi:broad-specificity NMP kinase